jgi:signal transduction histidine kinase/ActR/RegA family two-component response regulator
MARSGSCQSTFYALVSIFVTGLTGVGTREYPTLTAGSMPTGNGVSSEVAVRAREAVDLLASPAFLVDVGGNVVACNTAAARLVGGARTAAEGRVFAELFEDGAALWASLGVRAPTMPRARLRTAAGTLPCRIEVAGPSDPARTWLVVTLTPDTEPPIELRDLRTAYTTMRGALDRLGAREFPPEHGIMLIGPDGRIEHVANRLESILGIPAIELHGTPLSALPEHLGIDADLAEEGTEATWALTHADGSERVIRQRVVPLQSGDGRRIGQLCIFHDATAAIERSHELAEKSRELDEARARLTRAQHLKALGELAAEVAHEFGNLLQAIGLQTAALRRQPALPEPVTRALWSIKQAVDIGQALSRRLLTFARDDPNDRMEPLDVGRVLRDIVQLLEPRLNKGNRALQVELSLPTLPLINASQIKLTEAFLNIFLNALDAIGESGTLHVSAAERSGEIRIAVRDTGKGMNRDEMTRAFDPFFTTKPGGTGLGLSTVYGVVRAHRGSVFLESEEGKGTTVFVSLPTTAPPAIAMRPPTATRTARVAGRILVVDDHPTIREATSELLVTQGYEVESAGTVGEALEAINRERFAVVVTDVGLPDRPGWEVARAAKEQRPETLVILVSGWGSHFSVEEARARGADFVFDKPVDPDVLLSAIESRPTHAATPVAAAAEL